MADAAGLVEDVNAWLLDQGRRCGTVEELVRGLLSRLPVPVHRLWIGTKVLHPQAAAWLWIWTPETDVRTVELSYDRFAKLDQSDSPAQRLRKGAPFVRYTKPQDDGLSDIIVLWEQGYTDFYGNSLFFRGEWVGGFTWASRETFSDADIAVLEGIRPVLSAVIEPLARDKVHATLLRTYLGTDAGSRVAAGQVRRGDGQTLSAAIWFSDVRGFTRLSATHGRDEVLDLLNDVFEAIYEGLRAYDGQVLKFIGDGVLAVFVDDDERAACARAAAAAADVQARLADLRSTRTGANKPTARAGIGLHYGEVMYGNVGAPVRLDFTVIGAAVNLSARVEGLCGKLGETVLVTRPFADRAGTWSSVGTFELKGVPEPTEVLKPA